jgi:iron complex transport system substrate-binding protein
MKVSVTTWSGFILFCVMLLNAPVVAADELKRVISADGSVTEIVYALNAQDLLVGVDTTSRYPGATAKLPSVGYRRTLTAEGLLALTPDAILITPESGPSTTLQRLETSGVKVVRIPEIKHPEDLLTRVELLAKTLNKEEQGALLQRQLEAQIKTLKTQAASMPDKSALLLLSAGSHGMMIGGRNTQAQMVLDALGLTNAASSVESYKPFNQESVLSMQPQLIIVAETQPGSFSLSSWPSLKATPAAQHQKIMTMDSMYLLGVGPRWPEALSEVVAFTKDTKINGNK